ncbi:Yip1 family protein [Clostridium sp. Marseille-Q2269]|uniref:Yip1 family protein n=1 Tax=Clostridium sp. Marseille-Q2269 TaxID=2942205 RepID=UPI00207476C9|nr:Yip1 family protein [Clostridium sp. Marseille-Q2269]
MEQQENVNTTLNLTLKEKFKFFFTSPARLFEYYREKPKYGILFLITLICSVIYTVIQSNLSKDIIEKHLQKQFQGLDPQAAEIAKKTGDFMHTPSIQIPLTLISIVFSIFMSALLIFIIFKICKVALSYKQTVTLYLVANLAICVGNIFKTIYMLITQKPTDINIVLDPSVKNTLMNNLNIFSIWYYVLIGIGIYAMGKTSKKKAIIITVILAVISIGLAVLAAASKIYK